MSFFKPKFVLLALLSALLPALSGSGCTGGAFTGSDAAGGQGNSGGKSSGGGKNSASAGLSGSDADPAPGASTVACSGPEDCDDKDVCTTDRCGADGICDASPKCPGSDKCCGGDCAQCCVDGDCDDGLKCTQNTCFAGQCRFVPKDTECAPAEYCSTKDGCKERQSCSGLPSESADACDDESGCTVDSCEKNFCQHEFCPLAEAKQCCDGKRCAACCDDAQCDTDDDPCTVGSCQDGKCSVVSRCADGDECCPSSDRTTATCGKCCSAEECDDKIGCTLDKCGGGQCSNTPLADHCGLGYLCVPEQGGCTKAPDCTEATVATDCPPTACQTNPRCDNGTCGFDPCASGSKCCSDGCAACCGDGECNDDIPCTIDSCGPNGCSNVASNDKCPTGYSCNAKQGCLASCQVDDDCQLRIITLALPIVGLCKVSKCVKGQCQDTTVTCGLPQTCCAATGTCMLPTKCLQTQ